MFWLLGELDQQTFSALYLPESEMAPILPSSSPVRGSRPEDWCKVPGFWDVKHQLNIL